MNGERETTRARNITKNSLWLLGITGFFRALSLAIKIGFPSWAAVMVFREAAGKETVIQVMSNAFELFGPSTAEIIIGSVLLAWALTENHLRRYKTKKLSRRIRELEQRRDPNRESSGLTETGGTHPGDRA